MILKIKNVITGGQDESLWLHSLNLDYGNDGRHDAKLLDSKDVD